jgi:hypothetical protein
MQIQKVLGELHITGWASRFRFRCCDFLEAIPIPFAAPHLRDWFCKAVLYQS